MTCRRLEPFLPIVGVVGLIAIWYDRGLGDMVVDPVLLPSPALGLRTRLWKGMNGGELGIDFVQDGVAHRRVDR